MGIDEDHPDNKTSLELVLTKSLLVDADNRVLGAFLFNERRMELTSCVKCLFSANPYRFHQEILPCFSQHKQCKTFWCRKCYMSEKHKCLLNTNSIVHQGLSVLDLVRKDHEEHMHLPGVAQT